MPVSDMTQPMFFPGFVPSAPHYDNTTTSSESSEDGPSPTTAISQMNLSTSSRPVATQASASCPTPITDTVLRTQSQFYMTGVSGVSPSTLSTEIELDCTICFDRLATNAVKLHVCDHMFHMDCILLWFDGSAPRDGQRRGTCPNCRCELYAPDQPQDAAVWQDTDVRDPSLVTEDIDEGPWGDEDYDDDEEDYGYDYENYEDDDALWDSDDESADEETRRFSAEVRRLNTFHPARPSRADFEYEPVDLYAANPHTARPAVLVPEQETQPEPQISPDAWPEERDSDEVYDEPPAQRATRVPHRNLSPVRPLAAVTPCVHSTTRPQEIADESSSTIDSSNESQHINEIN
ncbi:hypothetical protein T440DRAFT_478214 [Plenodomus tracheiphilus IPT5]|uniref:RING-type domain-containing protein n=1 Tax=Plenodomus tracheiphilus IPT5 TaxID=1408161 RepID=A0A6A7BBG2_9PLEO|nr:hypothetical protein T440DRAFT_478214 [Plenodomus tracheiphilus IPT5]